MPVAGVVVEAGFEAVRDAQHVPPAGAGDGEGALGSAEGRRPQLLLVGIEQRYAEGVGRQLVVELIIIATAGSDAACMHVCL